MQNVFIMHHNLPISKENGDINIYLNNLDNTINTK